MLLINILHDYYLYTQFPLCCHSLSTLTLSCDMQVILRNDVSECEEVLKALEEDPEKETKLKEMNEEGRYPHSLCSYV